MAVGSVETAKNNAFVHQIVTTSSGEKVEIPTMAGSTIDIKPTKDGKYQETITYPNPPGKNYEPKVSILSEDELIAKYGNQTGKKLQVVA